MWARTERKVAQPAVFALADVVLDARVAAVSEIKLGDLIVWLVVRNAVPSEC